MNHPSDFEINTAESIQALRNVDDLVQLMNGTESNDFYLPKLDRQILEEIAYSDNAKDSLYKLFHLKKKTGGYRSIHAPQGHLMAIQKVLALYLSCIFTPHDAAMGFCRNRTVMDNARPHVNRNFVFNLDLKDFFNSIHQDRIQSVLKLEPFNFVDPDIKPEDVHTWEEFKRKFIGGRPIQFIQRKYKRIAFSGPIMLEIPNRVNLEDVRYAIKLPDASRLTDGKDLKSRYKLLDKLPEKGRAEIGRIIAGLCCAPMAWRSMDNTGEETNKVIQFLPQGAPTSPLLSNAICQKLDFLLSGVAKKYGLNYTRYADDITFSAQYNAFKPAGPVIQEIHRIIHSQHFTINERKTRLQGRKFRQEVTGLIVNEKPNLPKKYIKGIRVWLYYWERYGYERAQSYYVRQHFNHQAGSDRRPPKLHKVLRGKLSYLKMIKGGDAPSYKLLRSRFDMLHPSVPPNLR